MPLSEDSHGLALLPHPAYRSPRDGGLSAEPQRQFPPAGPLAGGQTPVDGRRGHAHSALYGRTSPTAPPGGRAAGRLQSTVPSSPALRQLASACSVALCNETHSPSPEPFQGGGSPVSLAGTCLVWEGWQIHLRHTFVWKHTGVPPPRHAASPLSTLLPKPPRTLQPLRCHRRGQCILHEAVKPDDSFPCQCGPRADPSVIYSTDPPASSSLITNERKETERSRGGVMTEKQGRLTGRGSGGKEKSCTGRPERETTRMWFF